MIGIEEYKDFNYKAEELDDESIEDILGKAKIQVLCMGNFNFTVDEIMQSFASEAFKQAIMHQADILVDRELDNDWKNSEEVKYEEESGLIGTNHCVISAIRQTRALLENGETAQ